MTNDMKAAELIQRICPEADGLCWVSSDGQTLRVRLRCRCGGFRLDHCFEGKNDDAAIELVEHFAHGFRREINLAERRIALLRDIISTPWPVDYRSRITPSAYVQMDSWLASVGLRVMRDEYGVPVNLGGEPSVEEIPDKTLQSRVRAESRTA